MARCFVVLAGVVCCFLSGLLPIAARPTAAGPSYGSRQDAALTTLATESSHEDPADIVLPNDFVNDPTWFDDLDNETDEWNAALDSLSPDTIILTNDHEAAASPDPVSRAGGRHFRRRSASRIRRTPSWDDACRGEESIYQDDYYEDDDVDVVATVNPATESTQILQLNGTLFILRNRLFADVRRNYGRYCTRRRRLIPTEPSSSVNGTEHQEDIMCQLNNRLKQVAYLTKLFNDSETAHAQVVVRSRTALDELEALALDGSSGIYLNLCLVQRAIAERGLTCSPANIPSSSPGGSSTNPQPSRIQRFVDNCNRLREIETLLNGCVQIIRQAAAPQTQGMTSS